MFIFIAFLLTLGYYCWFTYKTVSGNNWYYCLIEIACCMSGYKTAQYRLAVNVARFETGDFKSNIFKSNKNMFGMQFPTQRATTAVSDLNGFATFKNYYDSARDFFMWLKYRGVTKSMTYEQTFQVMVDKGYMGTDPAIIKNYTAFIMAEKDKPSALVMKWIYMVLIPVIISIALVVAAYFYAKRTSWLRYFKIFSFEKLK